VRIAALAEEVLVVKRRSIGLVVQAFAAVALLLSVVPEASAWWWFPPPKAPEIDPGVIPSVLALLSGGVILLLGRARRR
jgi:hypothetical protein